MSNTPLRNDAGHEPSARIILNPPPGPVGPVPSPTVPTVPTAPPAPPVSNDHPADRLQANQQLLAGGHVDSPNGRVRLVLQKDGNLVLYRNDNGVALWSSRTSGKGVVRAVMQQDGNLVCYDSYQRAQWAAGTNGKGGTKAVLQDDGNFVIYTSAGKAVWASDTWHAWSRTSADTDDQHLDTGEWMNSSASIASTGLISGRTRIWTTNESRGFHGSVFPVLFDSDNKAIWPSNIDAVKHQYGVDGTWIPGLPSDRTVHWTSQVDAATMAKARGFGLVQFEDPKNMLLRDLDIIGKAWTSLAPIVKTFLGGK